MLFWLFYLSSISPIICISYDPNFHTIRKDIYKNKNFVDFRISLICLPLGGLKLYICTYAKGFKFFKALRLQELFEENIEQKSVDLYNRVMFMNPDDKNNILKSLELKIEEEAQRNSTASTKVSIYNNILIVIDSLIIFRMFSLYSIYEDLMFYNTLTAVFLYLIFIMSLLWFININILSFSSIKVSGYDSFSLKRIINSNPKDLEMIKGLYYKWLNVKKYNRILVSYILNMQTYMILSIFGFLFLVLIYNINEYLLTTETYTSTMICL